MLLSSILLTVASCSVARAGPSQDITSNSKAMIFELTINSVCSVEDLSTTLSTTHVHTDLSSLNHSGAILSKPLQEPMILHTKPWDIHPTCSLSNGTSFCVFTASDFLQGRGISFVTKPFIAAKISKFPAFSSHHTKAFSSHDSRSPAFRVTEIPGRGMGLIANRTIERGDLIKAHPAIAIFHNDAVDKSSALFKHTRPLMKTAVDQLPPPTKELFLNMAAHNESEEPIIERIYTNTFGENFGGEEHSVVVPETARLNHDCRPNAMYYFDHRTFMHYTHASRTIYAGEEITITYVDPLQTRLRRRDALKRSWGFECSCNLCLQESVFTRESNRRIMQIRKLTDELGESDENEQRDRTRKVKGTPEMAELLVSLYEQERLHASIADAYRLAALSYSAVGNEWMAVKWAMKAVETGLIHDGPREEQVLDMERFLDDPRKHWSWEVNVNGNEN